MTSRCSFQYKCLIFCLLSTCLEDLMFSSSSSTSFITWEVLLILWTCKWVMDHLPMSYLDTDQISAPALPQLLICAHPKHRQSHHTRPGKGSRSWWALCSALGLGEDRHFLCSPSTSPHVRMLKKLLWEWEVSFIVHMTNLSPVYMV